MFDLKRISVQSSGLTIATTGYSAGDQVDGLFTLADAARVSGGTGMIVGAVLIDAANIVGAYDVIFFDSSVTLINGNNGAFAISDADALKVVGVAQLAGAYGIGNNRVGQEYNLAMPYVCSGSASLYAGLICKAAHTFFGATTDLQLIVYCERN